MKLYLIVQSSKIRRLENVVEKIKSSLDKEGMFSLCKTMTRLDEVLDMLYKHSVRAMFLEMWVSETLLKAMTKADESLFENPRLAHELSVDQRIFNSIILNFYGVRGYRSQKEKYYNYGYLINKPFKGVSPNSVKKKIDFLNERLKVAELLISKKEIKPSMLLCFIQSLKEMNIDELRYSDMTIDEIEQRHEEFYELVLSEFILQSSEYYSKEDIKSFIEKRILSED